MNIQALLAVVVSLRLKVVIVFSVMFCNATKFVSALLSLKLIWTQKYIRVLLGCPSGCRPILSHSERGPNNTLASSFIRLRFAPKSVGGLDCQLSLCLGSEAIKRVSVGRRKTPRLSSPRATPRRGSPRRRGRARDSCPALSFPQAQAHVGDAFSCFIHSTKVRPLLPRWPS